MKKILLYTFGLFLSLSVCGQSLIVADSIQTLDSDSTKNSSKTFVQSNLKNVTKSQGDSAYVKEDFGFAAQIYESLLEQGESAEVYYNLGNSYYKDGEIAKAVLNYERALLLQPGNGDIRANLEIARSKTIDKIESTPEIFFISWTKALIDCMSVDAWAKWGIALFLLWIIALYFFIFSKRVVLKKVGFVSSMLFLVMTVITNLFASEQKNGLTERNSAIVMKSSVTVRSTPSESGTTLFVLHEGCKVSIKDHSMKEWKEIRLEDGKVGWVPSSAIEAI